MQHAAPLTVSIVAKRLGISEPMVRKLDGELQPERAANGTRLYRVERVDAVAAERAQRTKR